MSATEEDPSTASLAKVRDLLFGEQLRSSERRMSGLEERIAKEIESVRVEVLKRLDGVEAATRRELEALSKRLKDQAQVGGEFQKDIGKQVGELGKALEKRAGQIETAQSRALAEVQDKLLDETKACRSELEIRAREIEEGVRAALDDMRAGKVDRTALAALLADLAVHISETGKKSK
ncbi:MAG: hypothetical protein IT454_17030 [Planctomycetes bacterium]|nr:hypothetical protein [Planctomycetota bacterium]